MGDAFPQSGTERHRAESIEKHERDIWDAQTVMKALELCDDPFLSLAINLAFSCSLRMGELIGVTWNCV